jgi:hypothetical protein
MIDKAAAPKRPPRATQVEFDNASPIFWLRESFLSAKNIPPAVKKRIAHLFKKQPRYNLENSEALLISQRLTCLIHVARIEHALANTEPTDRRFLALSKSAATWMHMLAKFNVANKKAKDKKKGKAMWEKSPMSSPEDSDDVPGAGDAGV